MIPHHPRRYNFPKANYYDANNTNAYGPGHSGVELGSTLNVTLAVILQHGGIHYFSLCTEGDAACLLDPSNRLAIVGVDSTPTAGWLGFESTQSTFLVNKGCEGKGTGTCWVEQANVTSTVALQLPTHHDCEGSKRCVVVWQWLAASNGAEFGWFSCLDVELA